jgi:anti-anti-sigma factor
MVTLERTQTDGVTVLRLQGSLTVAELAHIQKGFEHATHNSAAVLIDLSNVDMLTTPAISMLLAAAKDLKNRGGKILVTGPQPRVGEVLKRLRLDHLLPVVASPEEGINQLKA